MIRWLVSLLLTVGLGVAPTEGTRPGIMATYESGAGVRRVLIGVWADDRGRARAVFAAGHGGMGFVTRDNVGYILDQDRNGSVGRQDDMLAFMVAGRHGADNRERLERLARQRVEIVRAGSERVAGITGDVYRLTLIEGATRSPPFEIVISAAPRLAPVGRELLRFYDSLRAPIVAAVGSAPQPYVAVRALLARGTPLRLGEMRLTSIEHRSLTDEQTALPGPVLSREAFTALLLAGPMGADPSLQYEPDPSNHAYGDDNEFVYANAVDEAVNDIDPEFNDADPEFNDTDPE